MNNLERYQKRQEQISRVDRWLDKHPRQAVLLAAVVAALVLSLAMLLKMTLNYFGGGK